MPWYGKSSPLDRLRASRSTWPFPVTSPEVLVLLAVGAFGSWAVVVGWERNDPGEMALLGTFLLALMRFMWRAVVRPRVDVYADGLQVIGFWGRHWIPGAAIRRIDAEDGMTVTTVRGDEIPVFGFSRSLLDRGQAAAAAGQMRRAKPARPGRPGEVPAVLRAPDWTWADLLFVPMPVLTILAMTGVYGTWS
ncbi:hypothetical protein [Streptomyces kanamyceticus]|uniref:PH domain-containing protein n=1 Tax=Streptomyces kanamyceticus TaxID=1967 RepID=A0A5J6G8D2_STRKN|nr:hypothetical protein [Streptomyces kanamyceticus]QEU91273.1 hypothetical protein CP970_10590 [Streptomyces kanamyceticus]